MDEVCKRCGSMMDEDINYQYSGEPLCPICDTLGSISRFLHERGFVSIATPSLDIDLQMRDGRVTMKARAVMDNAV